MGSKSITNGLLGLIIGVVIGFYMADTDEMAQGPSVQTVAFKHDGQGNPIEGSKEQLITAIRNGSTVRVGWGWKNKESGRSIEHLSSPIWLAVVNEKEVMAHLDPQVLSQIDWNSATATYQDSTLLNQEWRVVINTDGTFDAVWYDRSNNEVSRRIPQRHTMTWFTQEISDYSQTELHSEDPLFEN